MLMSWWGNLKRLIGYYEEQWWHFLYDKVVIDDVMWRLSEGIVEDWQGLVKKTLGAVKYNQTYLDRAKL